MDDIKLSIRSKRSEVVAFLNDLKELLSNENFDIRSDIMVIRKTKLNDPTHSTPFTLIDLEYDIRDVVERLKELKISEYSETLIDKDNSNPPFLFVFGKGINNKLVYIKLKIRKENLNHVICVSFHYAKDAMSFPYA